MGGFLSSGAGWVGLAYAGKVGRELHGENPGSRILVRRGMLEPSVSVATFPRLRIETWATWLSGKSQTWATRRLAKVSALNVVLELFDYMVLRESHPVHKISD
jgi:hypothetical protein